MRMARSASNLVLSNLTTGWDQFSGGREAIAWGRRRRALRSIRSPDMESLEKSLSVHMHHAVVCQEFHPERRAQQGTSARHRFDRRQNWPYGGWSPPRSLTRNAMQLTESQPDNI